MAVKLKDLIEESTAPEGNARICWAKRLPLEPNKDGVYASEYVEALEALWLEGVRPHWVKVSRLLSEQWGCVKAPKTVGDHFRGNCGCGR